MSVPPLRTFGRAFLAYAIYNTTKVDKVEKDFSIDMTAERINDQRTRELFREVYSSYSHGNYRSSIVMLWSVAICDIMFKLIDLRDLYADNVATQILTETEASRANNPNSPDWEIKLVEKIKDRTQLLEAADYINLNMLQQHRHLSAHPVLSATFNLYSPNRETTRAHIRNMLEGLLTKPAIMTGNIFDKLSEDLEMHRDILLGENTLIRYLEAKYLPHFSPALEDQLFRSFWAVVFRVTDVRCEANREINYLALKVLYNRRSEALDNFIRQHKEAFSNLTLTGSPLEKLLDFISSHPKIYPLLTDAIQAPIEQHLTDNPTSYALAWYMSGSIQQHIDWVLENVGTSRVFLSDSDCKRIVYVAEGSISKEKADEVAITLYIHSPNFDYANDRFSILIQPRLNQFGYDQLLMLLEGIEAGGQSIGRRRAEQDHKLVKKRIDTIMGSGFDPKKYPQFSESIKLPKSDWYIPQVYENIEEE